MVGTYGLTAKRSRPLFALIALSLAFANPARAPAEAVASGEIRLSAAFLANSDGFAPYPGGATGGASIGLEAGKSDAIKASVRASIDAPSGGVSGRPTLTLDRAYAKARFPWLVENTSLRLTLGKAPLAWGKGFVFNAGDPVFGALPASSISSVGTTEFRTATAWMATLNVPVGDFSFAEAVWLAPVDGGTSRGGGRIVLAPGLPVLQSVEAGFLLTDSAYRSAYLAVDGSLFFDWYAAASLAELARDPSGINPKARYTVSFGLFRIFDFIPDVPLTLRAEGLAYPEENRQLWFQSLQAGLTDELSVTLEGLFATGTDDVIALADLASSASVLSWMDGETGLAGIVVSLSPVKGFALSASVLKQFEKGDPMKPEAIIAAGCKYSF
jgi:hypothetical protein